MGNECGREAEDGGRGGDRSREALSSLFVRAASRTTTRRENGALRRVMSDMSDEMQRKNLHSRRGPGWGGVIM